MFSYNIVYRLPAALRAALMEGRIIMKNILIVFASATTVIRIKKQLAQLKRKAKTMQTPKSLSADGCSFSLVTSIENLAEVKNLARMLDVKIKGIYEINGTDYIPLY